MHTILTAFTVRLSRCDETKLTRVVLDAQAPPGPEAFTTFLLVRAPTCIVWNLQCIISVILLVRTLKSRLHRMRRLSIPTGPLNI